MAKPVAACYSQLAEMCAKRLKLLPSPHGDRYWCPRSENPA